MKMLLCLIVSVIVAVGFGGRACAEPDREARPRFKGVELYSWKDAKGAWVFALLSGTNRLKTEKEVKDVRNQIAGIEALKKALGHLAAGENVSWTHRIEGFRYPPAETVKEIKEYATKVDVQLRTPEPMKE